MCMPQRTPTTYAAALRLTAALSEGGGNAMQRAVLGAGLLARAGSIVDETQNWGEVAAGEGSGIGRWRCLSKKIGRVMKEHS